MYLLPFPQVVKEKLHLSETGTNSIQEEEPPDSAGENVFSSDQFQVPKSKAAKSLLLH